MSNFQLGSRETHVAAKRTEIKPHRVRMGVLSLFSLLIMISLAVLAVLAFTTANATLVMSQRQASAETQRYLDEVAAQEFVAQLDDVLASVRNDAGESGNAAGEGGAAGGKARGKAARDKAARADDGASSGTARDKVARTDDGVSSGKENMQRAAAQAVEETLDLMCSEARGTVGNAVQVHASVEKDQVAAQFECGNGRILSIVLSIQPDATYQIDRWSMSAVQNQEQPEGQLLIVD